MLCYMGMSTVLPHGPRPVRLGVLIMGVLWDRKLFQIGMVVNL